MYTNAVCHQVELDATRDSISKYHARSSYLSRFGGLGGRTRVTAYPSITHVPARQARRQRRSQGGGATGAMAPLEVQNIFFCFGIIIIFVKTGPSEKIMGQIR